MKSFLNYILCYQKGILRIQIQRVDEKQAGESTVWLKSDLAFYEVWA